MRNCGAKCRDLGRERLGKVEVGLRIRVGEREFYVNGYSVGFSLRVFDLVFGLLKT